MRAVVWADSARHDLLEIVRFIAGDNPAAAATVADRIDETAGKLGGMATGRPGRVAGTYEKVVVGLPYILAYAIASRPAGDEVVTILHVIHGARDWRPGNWPG